MWEEGDESGKVKEIARGGCILSPHIDDIADGVEDEERDADGQDDLRIFRRDGKAKIHHHVVEAVDTEVKIFEIAEGQEIPDNAKAQEKHRAFEVRFVVFFNVERDKPAKGDNAVEHEQEVKAPPSVKERGADQDYGGARFGWR